MTVSQASISVYFSNGMSQAYNLDATDGTEGAVLELVSGGEIGTAALGMTTVKIIASCENQLEYVSLVDNLGIIRWSTGGCKPEASQQPKIQQVSAHTIGLNWSLKVLTNAS
jgi:hypothetical protein